MIGNCNHGTPWDQQCDHCDREADGEIEAYFEDKSNHWNVKDFIDGHKAARKLIAEELGEEDVLEDVLDDTFEIVIADASGMEDHFDEGITYVAEEHEEADMVWVYDRFGRKIEVFEDRIKSAVS